MIGQLWPLRHVYHSHQPKEGLNYRDEDMNSNSNRDPRHSFYSSSTSYSAVSEHRGMNAYPPGEVQPHLNFLTEAAYDESYSREPFMNLDLDSRGRETYRGLSFTQQDYKQKRKYDGPEYMNSYIDDNRVFPFSSFN